MALRRQQIRALARAILNCTALAEDQQDVSLDVIARWIVRSRASKCMGEIQRECQRLQDEQSKTVRLRIVTAREFSKTLREHTERFLARLLGASALIAQWGVDTSVVGGVEAKSDTVEVKASVVDMLRRL